MGNTFGKRKTRVTEQDQAILQLKLQRDKLNQYRARIERNVEKETNVARKLVAHGQRDKAMLILRKRKFLQSLVGQSLQHLENVEQLIHDVEFAQIQANVVDTLKTGGDCLKALNKAVCVEDVERLLDETKEAAEYQQEISDILSGGLSVEDESAAERELQFLICDQELKLPEVPQTEEQLNSVKRSVLPGVQKEKMAQMTSE